MQSQTIDTAAVDKIVNAQLEENDPSLMVGIVKNGTIVYEKYIGLSNLQHQISADENTRSNIASVAKQFTALCVLQLSLDGQLNLEDDIRTYLPSLFPSEKKAIKIKHLLNHSSGIRDYSELLSLEGKAWWSRVGYDNKDVIELLEQQIELNFEPGTEHLYSNSNYTLLAQIVAEASGQSFHDYSKRLLESLGMTQTAFLKNYMYVIPNQALPYADWGDGIWQQYPMSVSLYGDGFLYTTLKDQLIYEQAIQNASITNNKLLLLSQKSVPNSDITNYGFGLEFEDRLNYSAVYHSGNTGSYHAQTLRFPEQNLSIFVMSNNGRLWSGSITQAIATILLPKKPGSVNTVNIPEVTAAKSDLSKLVGYYRTPKDYLIRISKKADTLYYQYDNNNPLKLLREGGNLFSFAGIPDSQMLFSENASEAINFTLYQPDSEPRVHKRSLEGVPTISELEEFIGSYHSSELEITFDISLEDGVLTAVQDNRKRPRKITAFTNRDLMVSNYPTTVERDVFGRVKCLLVNNNRIKNVRFTKKEVFVFQPKIPTDNGSISVSTIGSKDGKSTQILLTKNDEKGNEIWFRTFGGSSYEQAKSIIGTEDGGYLIVGATSSFGNGNYDVYVIKVDRNGKEQWSNTYGDFYNEYGYTAQETDSGYLIKGTKQKCTSNSDVFNRTCTTNAWFIRIDKKGVEKSNELLEVLSETTASK